MRYLVLACDYDGTLATDGLVDPKTIGALNRCLRSGRKLVLVTGRELDDLLAICPCLPVFEWVVAENGAVLHQPASGAEMLLAIRPPEAFVRALVGRGVSPCRVGRAIVATREPHEMTVRETIREFGLDLEVILNKGAVMILLRGVNKATGLAAALREMRVSAEQVVAVGDAENDHALLASCAIGVAVANATPQLRQSADLVTAGDHGTGVVELIDQILADDLAGQIAVLAGQLPEVRQGSPLA